jgi:hypothetical protein
VVGTVRSMLKAKQLPSIFWAETVTMTVYVLNRSPMEGVTSKTLLEVWYGKKSVMHHLRTFGCVAYVRNTSPNLKKLDGRS